MNRRWFLGLVGAAAIGLLLAPALSAEPVRKKSRPWKPPSRSQFSISLEDMSGRSLPVFHHRSQRFVLGSHGERYAVRVRNNTSSRVEAVVSVDGRDAISGRVADFARERGYVIPAHGSVRIDGFRRNMESVAAFRFTEPGNSYSARRGTPQNVGIIGAAFFPEMRRRPVAVAEPRSAGRTERESRKSQRRRPAPAKSKSSKKRRTDDTAESSPRGDRKNNIGTEYGETRMSRVVGVAFQRASRTRPARVVTVRYDDAEGLRARGIRIRPMHRQPVVRRDEPMAFPKRRFAPPPR